MAEIVALKTERAAFREEVVSLLEQALAEARAGDVAAVAIAVVRPDGHVNCGFTDFDTAGPLLGSVALLQARLIANVAPRD